MSLDEYLREMHAAVKAQMNDGALFDELTYANLVMEHLSEVGMTSEPVECQYEGKVGNSILKISGYSLSEDSEQLDLYVSLYKGVDEITSISDLETKAAAEQCFKFLSLCIEGKLASKLEPSSDVKSFALTLQEVYNAIDQIQIFVITDCVSKVKSYKPRIIQNKTIKLEVMDIERLYRHTSEGKARDELVINFNEIVGQPLPCVFVNGQNEDYDYALTAIPGEALRMLYEKYGARLLESNVRSFLSVKGRGVNAGILATLRQNPERFMAYNNGIVIIADELKLGQNNEQVSGITWLKGLQIVNGGQTTASLYFSKKKHPHIDLSNVRVAAKIIVMKNQDPIKEDALISDISRFANSQNSVKQSDLSANKPFHVEVEKLSRSTYCPDGISQWFYERAAGSYNTLLAREGSTPHKLKKIKEALPKSRLITKTDLARYINTWDNKPELVSLGSQKNFDRFVDDLANNEDAQNIQITPKEYKAMIAKAIIYRTAQKHLRPKFQAFQANIITYTISVFAFKVGQKIDLQKIWQNQAVSNELIQQLEIISKQVSQALYDSANGKMISEWAKKIECKEAVFNYPYQSINNLIPELVAGN